MSSPEDSSDGRQQAERLQALIDSSPLALVEFGLDTRIRLWNPAAERIFGWSREAMLGRDGTLLGLKLPLDLPWLLAAALQVIVVWFIWKGWKAART
jgi:PAS domain-containing protein